MYIFCPVEWLKENEDMAEKTHNALMHAVVMAITDLLSITNWEEFLEQIKRSQRRIFADFKLGFLMDEK